MKKTLSRSKTVESDLTKLDKRITRQSTFSSFGHANEFDYKRETKHLSRILKQCATAHTLDMDCILQFLSSFTCEQRLTIVRDLEFEYNYRIIDLVLERPESAIRACTLAMLIEPIELYARDFHDLLIWKQKGKSEQEIARTGVEILLALNNSELEKFREIYQQVFETDVGKDLGVVFGETSIISKLLIQLLNGERDEEAEYSATLAKSIAKKLYEAGEGTPGIDYDTFIKIFTCGAFPQLSAIFDVYEDKYGRPIQEAIEREFANRNDSICFQDIVEYTRSPGGYFSKILREALEKTPIDYRTVIRLIIGHQEKDLCEIKLEYSKLFDQTVDQTIHHRLENSEMKRLLLVTIHHGHDLMIDEENGPVRFDHVNNSHPTSHAAATVMGQGMRRNRSHEAFDKFVSVFKTIRPH